jgi:hypothetical protein
MTHWSMVRLCRIPVGASLVLLAVGACASSPASPKAHVAAVAAAIDVAAPAGISVAVKGTSALVRWGASPNGSVPLKGYQLYLDQTPVLNLGPQVTQHRLVGLSSGSHYVQVVAITAHDQSEPMASSFLIALAKPKTVVPSPTAVPVQAAAPVAVPTYTPPPASTDSAPPAQSQDSPIDTAPTATAISAVEACGTAATDFDAIDSETGAVIEGSGNAIATGHSFGTIIIELQHLSQNVSDSHLSGLLTTVVSDVVDIRSTMLSGGSLISNAATNAVDGHMRTAQEYCSSLSDPLGS